MTTNDVNRAIARLSKRLDYIMACTSGMPNFKAVAEKVTIYRAALEIAGAHDRTSGMDDRHRAAVIGIKTPTDEKRIAAYMDDRHRAAVIGEQIFVKIPTDEERIATERKQEIIDYLRGANSRRDICNR